MFKTLDKAIETLESAIRFKPKTDLELLKKTLSMLNLELSNIKKIHVAGTNGKGSTTAFLTNILMENDLKVGTFTSPYIEKFNDRIRINFKPIDDETLLKLINKAFTINDDIKNLYGETLSFFEMVFIMSLIHFTNEKCDVIVMEVGIGGLLDATNTLNYDVSLITSVGFDHMKQLGHTLPSIALNKLGIIKKGNYLITTIDESFYQQVNNFINKVQAKRKLIDKSLITTIDHKTFSYMGEIFNIQLLGDYQKENAVLALEAALHVYPNISLEAIKCGLNKTRWPGRLEYMDDLYIDGAHNVHAIGALSRNIDLLFPNKTIYIIFSALIDKDIAGMLSILNADNRHIILTSFSDARFKSLKAFETKTCPYIEDFEEALRYIHTKKRKEDVILITGSLHFISFVRKKIK